MRIILILVFVLGACNKAEPERNTSVHESVGDTAYATDTVSDPSASRPQLIPPAPGEVGGLPDDRTPVAEGPIDPKSTPGAAQMLEFWAHFMEAGNFDDAWDMSSEGSYAHKQGKAAYNRFWSKYAEIHVLIGAPGAMEGAAGSSYVEIPVQMYGRMVDGKPYNLRGPVVLRRVNDVPGATAEQLQWRIESTDLKPLGEVKEAASGG